MKKIINLSLVLFLVLTSCQKTPMASFHIDMSQAEVGKEVFFINDSQDATRFEWDFGDGYISKDESPIHVFQGSGSFEVKLTAFSNNGLSDVSTLSVTVKIPTLLEIEVREYIDEYTVPGASIILYGTITDWDAQTNEIAEGITDGSGIVVFANLDPFVHYVDVFEQHHDNYTLRSEDVGWIRTPEILPNKINRFIAWVDYVAQRKGDAKGARSAVIVKLERKHETKPQTEAGSATEDWQTLYAKRVVVK